MNVFPLLCMTGDRIKNMEGQGQCRQFGYLSIREIFARHVTVRTMHHSANNAKSHTF